MRFWAENEGLGLRSLVYLGLFGGLKAVRLPGSSFNPRVAAVFWPRQGRRTITSEAKAAFFLSSLRHGWKPCP
jgi:hypothetical protein